MKRSELMQILWQLPVALALLGASGCGQSAASIDPSAANATSASHAVSKEVTTPSVPSTPETEAADAVELLSAEVPTSSSPDITTAAAEPPISGATELASPATSGPEPSTETAALVPPVQSGHGETLAGGTHSTGSVSHADQEPLFVGWPKPALALMFTGRQDGYLEPCGCSGLENQKGGLVRRHTLLKELTAKGWTVLPIDAGNQIRRFGRQSEIKFQITIEGLNTMGYRAIAFGPDDLRLPAVELVGVILSSGGTPNKFVCANATVFDDKSFTSPYLVLEAAGKKIGITSVLGERNQNLINNHEIAFRTAEDGLAEVWPPLQQAKCDLYVLIAHASMEESVALAQKFPQFPLVITTGGAGEPTLEPEKIAGTRSTMIQVGTKGMFAGVVGLFDDPAQPQRYQRIPLDARFPDGTEMLQLLAAYQDQLKEAGFEGLGIRAQPHPNGGEFIGSASCAECHQNAWDVWKDGRDGHPSKHSHAYATLQQPPKRANVPRNHDPECLSCHVVGWNPQKYFPYESGFMSMETTPELINVGCENCHGPGAAHANAENGVTELTDAEIEKLRQEQVLTLENAEQKCLQCHDLDNSPAFQEEGAFQRYWEKIKHGKTPAE
ncbi:MAG: multiheme c-type cytochrome [Pirellulaceae bacterium]